MLANVESQNVSVLNSVQFFSLLEAIPMSNVVLRDKRVDRYIVLKRVQVFAEKGTPTKTELLNAWKSMYFNTWKMKFTIEEIGNKDLKCGNLFRNLDRFDVLMFVASELVFDTAQFNLDLVEGRVGLTPKSKTSEDFPTNKALKTHCYKVAESAWKMLNIDSLVSKSLVEAEKEMSANQAKDNGKDKTPANSSGSSQTETPTSATKEVQKAA